MHENSHSGISNFLGILHTAFFSLLKGNNVIRATGDRCAKGVARLGEDTSDSTTIVPAVRAHKQYVGSMELGLWHVTTWHMSTYSI